MIKALIVSSGYITDYNSYDKYFNEAQYLICADGGAAHMRSFGQKPHLLVGDFDSIHNEDLEFYISQGVEILKYPSQKDMTDTELAVEAALKKGCTDITMIGVLGSRYDHSLANIFLLKKILDSGVKGKIANECNEIMLIGDRITVAKQPDAKVTLLPVTAEVEGVTTKGLSYPLKDALIPFGSSWGVSNEFNEDEAEITIKKGLLLVILARD